MQEIVIKNKFSETITVKDNGRDKNLTILIVGECGPYIGLSDRDANALIDALIQIVDSRGGLDK